MTCPIHGCEARPFSYRLTGGDRVEGYKCPKCEAKAAHRKEQAENPGLTHSCPICNAAPKWKERPDAPGLWLWSDDKKVYRVALMTDGKLRINLGLWYLPEDCSPSWFGPIPEAPKEPKAKGEGK